MPRDEHSVRTMDDGWDGEGRPNWLRSSADLPSPHVWPAGHAVLPHDGRVHPAKQTHRCEERSHHPCPEQCPEQSGANPRSAPLAAADASGAVDTRAGATTEKWRKVHAMRPDVRTTVHVSTGDSGANEPPGEVRDAVTSVAVNPEGRGPSVKVMVTGAANMTPSGSNRSI